MDWVKFSRDQVDRDALPRFCMVCGEPTTECVDKTFSHTPEWVEYLYLAGGLPGLIGEHFFGKEMRVSCPVCPQHRDHWSQLIWVASVGWLLGVPFALVGLALGAAIFPAGDPRTIGLVVAGAVTGLVIWIVYVSRLAITRVKVSNISNTGDEITFERVSDAFARAASDEDLWSLRPSSDG